mmetsp:Transcript_18209/g.18268  ORF Transcript_18209/g.18268 Transcript_18209/m.18268 type:complete len:113 (+) Transcript_18209:101-439(+)
MLISKVLILAVCFIYVNAFRNSVYRTGVAITKTKTYCAAKDAEKAKVEKGLTHIKYNKYAPTAEEAANMTNVEFRATLYKRMKEAEDERRKSGPVGGVTADNYLESLEKRKA